MRRIPVIRQRPLEIFIHVISWLLVFILPLMLSDRNNGINWEQYCKHGIVLIAYCVIFYLNYFFLIPRLWFNGNTIKYISINILLLVVISLGIHYYQEFLFPRPVYIGPRHMGFPPPYRFFYFRNFLPMTFVVALSMVIRISQQWHSMKDKLNEIESEKTEAELTNLKNQLNPHFLLNTLNNIYALIAFNAEKAQEAVQELSKLLRYMLYENQSSYVPLEKELDFINNYVSLMRIRVSNSVEISVRLDKGPKEILISPLIFISLIENAFKHGISPTQKSFISISIQGHRDGKVSCVIMNSNFPKTVTDKSGSGIGLEQVYRRLELSYPSRYEWQKGASADGLSYTSVLTIQTEDICN